MVEHRVRGRETRVSMTRLRAWLREWNRRVGALLGFGEDL